MTSPVKKNALLLVGGGARAAYQVGVLRSLAKSFPNLEFPILSGVSAGAINAASLANTAEEFPQAVERMVDSWSHLTIDQVFNTNSRTSGLEILKWVIRMATAHQLPPFKGVLDSAPLRRFLCRSLASPDGSLPGIAANIRRGRLSAFGITTAQYPTGRTTTWVQGKDIEPWYRATRCGKPANLTVEHIMASTALPLIFPATRLEDGWHGDGGLRMSSPLSPVVHLGADRVMAISTLKGPAQVESSVTHTYPPLASVLNVVLDSVFLDMLDADAAKVQRINQLIADHPHRPEFGLRPVEVLIVRPSVDLGAIGREFVSELPRVVRHLLRGLGNDEHNHTGLLATLLFQPHYLRRVIEIGEKDGERRRDEFAAFFGFTSGKANTREESAPPYEINGRGFTADHLSTDDRILTVPQTGPGR